MDTIAAKTQKIMTIKQELKNVHSNVANIDDELFLGKSHNFEIKNVWFTLLKQKTLLMFITCLSFSMQSYNLFYRNSTSSLVF